MTSKKKRITISLAVLLLCAFIYIIYPRNVNGFYEIPEFTCACGHRTVIRFHDGNVVLYTFGHGTINDCGTYSSGKWHFEQNVPMYLHANLLGVWVSTKNGSNFLWKSANQDKLLAKVSLFNDDQGSLYSYFQQRGIPYESVLFQ
jgi:hypothetical protein